VLAGLGALTLTLGFGSTTALGEATLSAAYAAATGQVDIMGERSPGARTEANMTKGKARAAARALPATRDARSSIAAPIPGALPGPIATPAAAPTAAAAPAFAVPPEITSGSAFVPGAVPGGGGVLASGPGGGFFGPIGGGGIGGPGGGGGGILILPPEQAGTSPTPETPGPVVVVPETPGPGPVVPEVPGSTPVIPETPGPVVVVPETPVTPGVTTPPVPAPIPEPASWALMILGFGATGAALRRRARSVRCASPAQA